MHEKTWNNALLIFSKEILLARLVNNFLPYSCSLNGKILSFAKKLFELNFKESQ